MKFPFPFVVSLPLFAALAAAALHWRAARPSPPPAPASREALSGGDIVESSTPAESRQPTAEEILLMPVEKLRSLVIALPPGAESADSWRSMLICSRLAETDPHGGLRILLQRLGADGEPMLDSSAAIGFFSTWLADDRNDPAELLRSVTDPREKKLLTEFLGVASMIMGLNPSAAAKVSAALSGAAEDSAGRILAAQAESAVSPEAAVTKLLAMPDGEDRNVAVNFVLRNLSASDPAEALRLAETAVFNGGLSSIMGRCLEKLVKDKPTAALEYIVSHPGPVQASEFLTRWDSLLAAAGPEAVREAAAKVEDADLRNQIIGHAAVGLSATDPFAAARLMGGLEADELVMPLWREVAEAFAKLPKTRQDAWLQSLPPGPARDAAASALKR